MEHGRFISAPATGMNGLIARTAGIGLHYEAALVARNEGGRSETADSTLSIHGANAVTLVLTVARSFKRSMTLPLILQLVKKVLDDAAVKDFATLYRRDVKIFAA